MRLLGINFEVGAESGVKLSPSLNKTHSNYAKTLNLTRKYTHICSSRNILFSTKAFLIDVSISCKKSAFLAKIVPLLEASVKVVLDIF